MRDFKRKSGLQRIMQSKLALIFLSIIVLFFAGSLVSLMGKMQETARNKKIAEDKVAQLEKQKEHLSTEIDKLNTEQGVEDSIREKFGLAQDGEGVVVIVDDKTELEANTAKTSGGVWSWVKNLFK